ncbi:clavesin-1-like [Culicoides brevitarsis]|uniref:clavesin-1-like n=1 Tax=Culicoides brevitarsis TaxID=469753 RepID=UPI00307C7E68
MSLQPESLSVVKNPTSYDEYSSSLSKFYQKIAAEELRETDSIRQQSLQSFRSYIAKSPTILACRTDSVFLLRFLRVCKFSVPAACTKLERFIYIHQAYPQWFSNLSLDDASIREIINLGWCIPLPEKDELGRQVIFYQSKVIDPTKHTAAQVMRAQELIFQALYDDEEVQVAGIVFLFDDTEFTLQHVTMWSLTDMKEITTYISKALPLRQKLFVRAGLPAFARTPYDLIRSFLVEKVKERFRILKNFDESKTIVDPKLLPKEFGGTIPIQQLIQNLKAKLTEKREKILLQDKMAVNIPLIEQSFKTGDFVQGLVGNFRKLEVD